MNRIVLAVKAGADQPWLADAAIQVARQADASVSVLSMDGLEMEAFSTLPRDELLEAARNAADSVAARIGEAGLPVSSEARAGTVVRGILVFAEEQGADLIMVGASSRGPVASRLLGSVPMTLIQRARRPVLIVSQPGQEAGSS